MRKLVNGILIILAVILFLNADWQHVTIGSTSYYYYGIAIGDGRNDGVGRIYCGTMNGDLLEWSENEDNWTLIPCGQITAGNYLAMLDVKVGDARGDGINRVYVACGNGFIYEFSYENDEWSYEQVGGQAGWCPAGVEIGIPRNDGVIRLVGDGYMKALEFTWNGENWEQYTIKTGAFDCWAIGLGDGRGDGQNRVYCSDGYDANHCVREYSWNGSSYDETLLPAPNQMIKTAIGDARNDGKNRVYGAGRNGHVYEFTYENDQWNRLDIHPDAPNKSRYGLCIGEKIRGELCLYSVAQGGAIRQHYWANESWNDEIMDTITGATANVTYGSVNGGGEKIYVAGIYGKLYEFLSNELGINNESIDTSFNITNYPNPFNPETIIDYELVDNGKVILDIYNIKGELVKSLVNKEQKSGKYSVVWNGKNEKGKAVSSGVYLCKINVGAKEVTHRLSLIK